ncbi:hypothetical protein Dda_2425 [Drechslerella dactyloides]|uniref:Uncharacterized protein n=1 Tax=Drechslerella dactyloides TaxID=74499 RepID=A0AAD6J3P5_DREDA|nr:hypothetical protein Dda_2425 [Drechslerella dactyloides]
MARRLSRLSTLYTPSPQRSLASQSPSDHCTLAAIRSVRVPSRLICDRRSFRFRFKDIPTMQLLILGIILRLVCAASALASNAHHVAHPAGHLDAIITQPPHPTLVNDRLHPRQTPSSTTGRVACSALSSVYSWCASSGYGNLSGPSALPYCACYYSSTWVPRIFDSLATSCYDYVRSVQPNPAALSGIAPYLNICFLAGDVSKSLTQGSLACNTIATILTACAGRTNTRDLPFGITLSGSSSLANCACYTSSTYAPDRFDSLASACNTYTQNLAGQDGPISSLVSLCHNVGDVRLTASSALKQCESLESRLDSCKVSSGTALDMSAARQQASCLCYDTRSQWIPKPADAIASSCLNYLGKAAPQKASSYEAYANGFCESLGDVRRSIASTSAVPAATTRSSAESAVSSSRTASAAATASISSSRTGAPESSVPIPTAAPGPENSTPSLRYISLYSARDLAFYDTRLYFWNSQAWTLTE